MQASFCHVAANQVLSLHDVSNIWHVPLMMQAQGAHETICNVLGLGGAAKIDLSQWKRNLADKWDGLTEARGGSPSARAWWPFTNTHTRVACRW